MSVVISDDIMQAADISEAELRLEIAILLYDKKKLSTGKARQLAGLPIIEFRKELASRGICVHYDLNNFQEELETLKTLGDL
jgi:predicted HTH domain antitoxin